MWKLWPTHIVTTVSVITPQWKGFEDCDLHHFKYSKSSRIERSDAPQHTSSSTEATCLAKIPSLKPAKTTVVHAPR